MDNQSTRLYKGPYLTGTDYNVLGHAMSVVSIRMTRAAVTTPKDRAVFYPSHLSEKDIAEFQFRNRGLVSPWGTEAGQYLLKVAAYKDDYIVNFENFHTLRKNLLMRFAKEVEGNLTVVQPRPETEARGSIFHNYLLSVLLHNNKLQTINGIPKSDFIADYRMRVTKCRDREIKKCPSAAVFYIK